MKILIVSDIFGKTDALEQLALALNSPAEIFDPYSAEMMNFSDEKQAYDYFSSEVGLDKYTQALVERISACSESLYLIGFSVGAAAIWNMSNLNMVKNVSKATCFYGSQIRNHRGVRPRFQIDLVFPISELHFSVDELIADLTTELAADHRGIDKVSIRQVSFLHGFMNKYSKNYDQSGFEQEMYLLQESIMSPIS
ncbi:dienelactone hydrolase family protein [Shewanella sp. UCD-KL12]|uniref:dienelactone hydrolase family protein n=1 Tax=Shewanella sp. UCD-KL12 TaxID=1917163 RepID=UPI0009709E44|nr:dienelactone hydrolase family protein [Shewanella sp. UCD-KL12]